MATDAPTPLEIRALSAEGVDGLLERLEREVPARPALLEVGGDGAKRAIVFGDTHGDWRSSSEVVQRFEAAGPGTVLVGLGDYVDRTPHGLPGGSAVNALYLLGVAAQAPQRVVLLQGNHETDRRLPVRPRDLPQETEALWGPSAERNRRLTALLERGPVAAWTESGAYFAHAGFPRGPLPTPWTAAFDAIDDDRLLEIVWAECGASAIRRGAAPAFSEEELDRFLAESHRAVFLRGHDPDVAGRPEFHQRVLTLHTTSVYEQFGGILIATVPLDRPIRDLTDVTVEHLSTERRRAAAPR